MIRFLTIFLGILVSVPLSAFAFLGMNAGANLQGPLPSWTRQLGAASQDTTASSIASDSFGNAYVAGYTNGGLDGNSLTGTHDFFVTKYSASGTRQWTRQLGVTSQDTFGYAVATDTSGNVFVVGETTGGLDGNTLTGTRDFFVTKFDSSGARQWTKQLGVSSVPTYGRAAATDSSGNIYVAGTTDGGLDGNSLMGTHDVYVTKYNSSGTKQWTKQLGAPSRSTNGLAAATDSSGNVFVTGVTQGNLDGNTLAGIADFFVIKYDPNGTKQWTRQLGVSSAVTSAASIATDPSGNIFVAGMTTGALDGNSQIGTQDGFFTKYDSAGSKKWTQQFGVASSSINLRAITTDSFGNIFVAGSASGGMDGNTLTGTRDFFITKYTATGSRQWTKQMGSPSSTVDLYGATIDPSGRLYVAGATTKGLDHSSQTGTSDAFACQYIGN